MSNDISYSIIDHEGIKVIKLVGNVSSSNKNEMEDLINKISQKNNIIVNLQEVNLITSAGLNSLLNVTMNARKGKWKVMLMGVRESLRKMMVEMDIRHNFIIIDSIEEGVAKTRT